MDIRHPILLERLDQAGAEILTTSEWGKRSFFESDGVTVDFTATRRPAASYISDPAPSSHSPAADSPESMVYITKTGKNIIVPPALISRAARSLLTFLLQKGRIYSRSRCNPG